MEEINSMMHAAFDPETYRTLYSNFAEQNPLWNEIPSSSGNVYQWEPESTYIREPPYFDDFHSTLLPMSDVKGARPLAIFGDSVTTDHISPAGAIKPSSPGRPVPARARRRYQRLQQLRRAAWQSRNHGTRHLRKRPDQEPDGAGS